MFRKVVAIVGSAVFLVIAPGFVAGLVPYWISHWRLNTPFFGLALFRFAGGILATLGAIGLLDSFARFAVQGVGTPAPVIPTRHLVVTGLYRYVRNPMYVAVVSTILGQGLILGNVTLLAYGGLVWLLFHLFVLAYEEPKLKATFGSEYRVSVRKSRGGFHASLSGGVVPKVTSKKPTPSGGPCGGFPRSRLRTMVMAPNPPTLGQPFGPATRLGGGPDLGAFCFPRRPLA